MNKKSKKGVLIVVLCLVIVIMGVGYAVLSSTLNITGTVQASGSFNVEIISIVETNDSSTNGGAVEKSASYNKLNATFSAKFSKPGDFVEYVVTVKNKGTIDAVLSSILVNVDSQVDANDNPIYIFTALDSDGLDVTQYRDDLVAGESKTVTVKILFNENSVGYAAEDAVYTMLIDATQKSTSDYHESERLDKKCFVSVVPGEINYYDTNNPECGGNVEIPDGLRLPVRTITSYTFNNDLCLQNSNYVKAVRALEYSNANDVCNYLQNEFNNSTIQEILDSDLAIYTNFVFGEETGKRNLITKVGAGSFAIKNISSVSFSNDITEMGYCAFMQNTLTSLTLPPNTTKISDFAFFDNQIAGTLTFPRTINNLGIGAFEINSIENVVFDRNSNLTLIPEECFNQNKIASFTLPDNLEVIDMWSFSDNLLTTLNFQNNTSLREIGGSAFKSNRLASINFGTNSSLEEIGMSAFSSNILTGTLTIPKTVKKIKDIAFGGSLNGTQNNITALVFEANSVLEEIGLMAFRFNSIGGTLNLPSSLKIIHASSFANNKLEEVHIGANIEYIGQASFTNNKINNVDSLSTIYIDMTRSNFESNVKFLNNKDQEVASTTWYPGTTTLVYNE